MHIVRHPGERRDPEAKYNARDSARTLTRAFSRRSWVPAFAGMTMLFVTACGGKGDLERPAGKAPIPVAFGATAPATTERLLVPPPQAAPDRADDPVKNSKPRQDDKFDLPPPG